VGDQQGGGGPLGPDPLELEVEVLAGHLVEGAEGLVEQEDLGLDDQGPGDGDPLAHAAGQLRRAGVLEALEPDQLDQRVDRLLGHLGAAHLQRELDVGPHRPPREQGRVLEGDAEVAAAPGDRRGLAVDQGAAGGRLLQVGQDAQDRRLAAARRAQQGDEGAVGGGQADVVEGGDRRPLDLELLGEPLEDDAQSPLRHGTGRGERGLGQRVGHGADPTDGLTCTCCRSVNGA
jgi:hypothetical protein